MIETLGQYKILERIGDGTLGDTYRARDTRLGRTVTLTIVRREIAGDPARRRRFVEEARAAADLSHPNIAILYDVSNDDPLYVASEFVAGKTVRALTSAGPLNPRRAVDLAVQLADALAEAHAAGIVHGRLSSDTIVVTGKGSAKIIDFGLAHWSVPLETAAPPGTSPPSTHATATELTDLHDLGGVFLDMLGGTPRKRESDLDGRVPDELRQVVAKTLSRPPGSGYQAAATLAAELRSIAAIFDVRGITELPAGDEVRRGRPLLVWVAVAATLMAIAWLIWAASRPG